MCVCVSGPETASSEVVHLGCVSEGQADWKVLSVCDICRTPCCSVRLDSCAPLSLPLAISLLSMNGSESREEEVEMGGADKKEWKVLNLKKPLTWEGAEPRMCGGIIWEKPQQQKGVIDMSMNISDRDNTRQNKERKKGGVEIKRVWWICEDEKITAVHKIWCESTFPPFFPLPSSVKTHKSSLWSYLKNVRALKESFGWRCSVLFAFRQEQAGRFLSQA